MPKLTNEQKLRKLFVLMDNEAITREEFKDEFLKHFQEVIKAVEKIKSHLEDEYKNKAQELGEQASGDREMNKNELGKLKREYAFKANQAIKEINQILDKKIEEINLKLLLVKDGKDADEDKIVAKVREQIDIPKIEEKTAEEIRDGLEGLKGDERLDASAIKGLGDRLDKFGKTLKTKWVGSLGGVPRPQFVDNETPGGTVNGSNKAFTVNNHPSPAESLRVYVNGQRMKLTSDYTYSNKTITFTTAPGTGAVLLVEYRM